MIIVQYLVELLVGAGRIDVAQGVVGGDALRLLEALQRGHHVAGLAVHLSAAQ